MTPTIGRIVLYQRHGSPNGQHKSEPSPAIITAVPDIGVENQISLCVFNPTGLYFNEQVPYDSTGERPGTWRWPPKV